MPSSAIIESFSITAVSNIPAGVSTVCVGVVVRYDQGGTQPLCTTPCSDGIHCLDGTLCVEVTRLWSMVDGFSSYGHVLCVWWLRWSILARGAGATCELVTPCHSPGVAVCVFRSSCQPACCAEGVVPSFVGREQCVQWIVCFAEIWCAILFSASEFTSSG